MMDWRTQRDLPYSIVRKSLVLCTPPMRRFHVQEISKRGLQHSAIPGSLSRIFRHSFAATRDYDSTRSTARCLPYVRSLSTMASCTSHIGPYTYRREIIPLQSYLNKKRNGSSGRRKGTIVHNWQPLLSGHHREKAVSRRPTVSRLWPPTCLAASKRIIRPSITEGLILDPSIYLMRSRFSAA